MPLVWRDLSSSQTDYLLCGSRDPRIFLPLPCQVSHIEEASHDQDLVHFVHQHHHLVLIPLLAVIANPHARVLPLIGRYRTR
jgi:hypothetical protein